MQELPTISADRSKISGAVVSPMDAAEPEPKRVAELEPNGEPEEALRAALRVLDVSFVRFLNVAPREWYTDDARVWQLLSAECREDLDRQDLQSLRELRYYFRAESGQSFLYRLGGAVRSAGCARVPPVGLGALQLSVAAAVGMTAKKQHEVSQLCGLVRHVSPPAPDLTIVDVGCGEGHLTLALSVLCGYQSVVGLEGSATARPSLGRRVQSMRSVTGASPVNAPVFHQLIIDDSTDPVALRAAAHVSATAPLALVGLHCCGQLATNLMRLFVADGRVRSLLVVGCCYGRAGTVGADTRVQFPLSAWLRTHDVAGVAAAYDTAAYRAATESPHLWARQNADSERVVREAVWRFAGAALLQQVGGADVTHTPGRINFASLKTFSAFVRVLHARSTAAALPLPWSDAELDELFTRDYLTPARMHRTLALLSLRSCLSGLVETLVVLDRAQWLREQLGPTVAVRVVPCFDEALSPRNLCIVAQRHDV